MHKALSLSYLAYAVGVAASTASPSSLALDASAEVERVQVTGSHIRRTHNEDATPLHVLSAEDIQRSGKVTLTDVLRDMTVNTGNSYDEQFTSSFSAGSASIGLRGLSPKNTLVLVNGQRVSNYGFALGTQDTFVDLNALPLSAVSRIEVLKDGASAAYGSDAIAGVVNIILRRDYEGLQLSASAGGATEGSLQQFGAGLLAGTGSLTQDGYNLTLSIDVLEREELTADQRRLTRSGDFRDQPGGRLAGWITQGGNYLDDAQNPRPFENCPEGTEARAWTDFTPGRDGQVCAFNGQKFNTLQPEVSRRQLSLQASYQVTPELEAFTQWLYSYNEAKQTFGAPLSVGPGLRAYNQDTGTLDDITVAFPVGHPNNTTAAPLPFDYTFFSVGPRLKENIQIFNRILAGFDYAGENWDLNFNALQSQSRQREYVDNFIDRYAFESLLESGGYDFVSGQHASGAIEALRLQTRRPGFYQIQSLNVNASRTLAHWLHGDVGFATGLDWRNERMDAGTSPEVLSGTELRPAINLIRGERDVIAAFAELELPLLDGLTVNTALRADHYDDFGSAVSPKLSSHYLLHNDWLLRASWSRGFRAPSLPEISQSNTISYGSVIDPNDPVTPGASRGYTQLRSGNPDLRAERSTNYNVGAVWSPSPSLSASIDYFEIKQDNVISPDNAQYIINNEAQFPQRVQRDTEGRLQIITNRYANQGTRTTSGFDIDLSYRFDLLGGIMSLNSNWSRLLEYEQAVVAGEAAINGAGNNQFGALPKWQGSQVAHFQRDVWSFVLSADYTHGYEQRIASTTSNPGLNASVRSHTTLNTQLSYAGLRNTVISLSVQNLTDRQPPFDPSAGSYYYDITQYNARGRFIDLGIQYQF
ncbi:TonB-dependent receptor plug domain-containing protein [Aliidiomarina maris]|uniref:Iron complex outermembrane receptor protein n=1 Tax=Aliidiomarina maris TaxID=531312 RepID=A0A327XB33_9GAMM|nr:TonB-dependent receptor [Aliidiomarina maris]RAK01426.1 iron complex outermembrane receptor protein [Aliidiomarina maris]RUO28267.1 TonB-dependent receptor [Aliidiomarina maris]